MSQNEKNTPAETPEMDIITANRVMQERVTRRAALRKLGFGAGMAALALLTTDDLARMVGKRLEQIAGDNKIAHEVAVDFMNAGIAFATPPQGGLPGHCSGGSDSNSKKRWCCTEANVFAYCSGYNDANEVAECNQCCQGVYNTGGFCAGFGGGGFMQESYATQCSNACYEHY